ncbi:diguanylate cyclase [Maridesulfovibrio sp.]|uniref:diguanylate cyclase n=1 Tax=Maridesulfovibrio sp. TaxID=2795000 RepID=UPI002A18C3BE|nr:diguanylate cyclase [Maridesulfovibrio sp.]
MIEKITDCLVQPLKVLIVEDSLTFSGILKRRVQDTLDIESVVFASYAEAEKYLEVARCEFFAALLDLNLPDAPNGEIVDLVVSHHIPSIVFTGEMSDDLRDIMWAKRIVDYVPKDNLGNIDHVVNLVDRLRKNISTKVLVVDDSSTSRNLCRSLLEVWNFKVVEAKDGFEALQIIQNDDNISLVIVDHYMPGMDGLTLVKELRRNYSKSRLPIIGLSGVGGATTSAYFLKAGANDYIHKPFLTEEFYCRVTHNIENAEYISMIKTLSDRDYLTGIYNRRSFFQYGEKLFAQQKRSGSDMVLAMIDIDHFKRCNDSFGHDVGDEVIQKVARSLAKRFRKSDIVCRYGGEEFCILCADINLCEVQGVFDLIREEIGQSPIYVGKKEISITISIGLCGTQAASLNEMISIADDMLYRAKKSGRNKVCFSGTELN